MQLLYREFEDATVLSIGHRFELEAFHSRQIILKRVRRGAKFVSDIYLFPKRVSAGARSGKELGSHPHRVRPEVAREWLSQSEIRARATCHQGHVGEAVALYDSLKSSPGPAQVGQSGGLAVTASDKRLFRQHRVVFHRAASRCRGLSLWQSLRIGPC
jgi:hypothetical protein